MKPEQKRYIDEHAGKESAGAMARKLGLKERKVRKYLDSRRGARPEQVPVTQEETKDASPLRFRFQPVFVLVVLVIAFILFSPCIKGPFLLDDIFLIKDNPLIRSLSNVPTFFVTDVSTYDADEKPASNLYRPIPTTAHAIDFFLWGDDSRGFHISNIIFHLVNAFLIFVLMRKLFGGTLLPHFMLLIFAIHPVNTSCVCICSGKADTLVALFILLSLIFYADYSRKKSAPALFFSVLAFMGAMYCKEYALLTVPLLLLVHNVLFDAKSAAKIRSYAFHFLPLAVYIPMRLRAIQGVTAQVLEVAQVNLFPRVFTTLKTLFIDFRILLLPYDLHFGRTTRVEFSLFGSVPAFLTVLGLIGAGYILYASYKKWRRRGTQESGMLFFGISWFIVAMIPMLNIFPLQVFLADNWLYFPSIGAYVVFFAALSSLWRQAAFLRKPLLLFICGMFVYYGFLTVERSKQYQDVALFYLSSVKWRPNVKFYQGAAVAYAKRRDFDNAAKYFNKAIEINKVYPSRDIVLVYFNMALMYIDAGQYAKAEEAFTRALALEPDEALQSEIRQNLALLRQR